MPRGLEFHRVENPIRVFHLRRKPVRYGVIRIALEIRRYASLQLRADFRIARALKQS